jgi:hypothetical protein
MRPKAKARHEAIIDCMARSLDPSGPAREFKGGAGRPTIRRGRECGAVGQRGLGGRPRRHGRSAARRPRCSAGRPRDGARRAARWRRALAAKAVLDQPAAQELLVEAARVLAAGHRGGVAVGVPVARAVGGVDLVDEDDLAVVPQPSSYLVSTRIRPRSAAIACPAANRASSGARARRSDRRR